MDFIAQRIETVKHSANVARASWAREVNDAIAHELAGNPMRAELHRSLARDWAEYLNHDEAELEWILNQKEPK